MTIQTTGTSFLRRRSTRVAFGAFSVMGLTALGVSPAFAATDADCADANTVDAGAGGTVAAIQTLLDADTAIVCLSGTFVLGSTLTFDHELTLFGLGDAVLDGDDSVRILQGLASNPVTVQNLTFQNGSTDSYGGAIYAYAVTAIDSHFDNNFASFSGGAIAAYGAVIQNSTFDLNRSGYGGAVQTQAAFGIENSTFTNNSAEFGGAVNTYGTGEIVASTFEGNSVSSSGGAVSAEGALTVTNSTFVDNRTTGSGIGGAIVADSGLVLQSTFLNNTAGGGFGNAVSAWGESPVEVRGNIFAGTASTAQVGAVVEGSIIDLGGNLFSTTEDTETQLDDIQGSTGFGLSVALLFDGATLASNGGPTQTVALYGGSPAVDAVPVGEPSVETDQRGVPRDALSDSGAYEWQGAISPEKPALAATGSEVSGWAAGVAGILLAAGAVLFVGKRRRRA